MALEIVSLRPVRTFVAKATAGVAFNVVSGVALAWALPRIHWLPLALVTIVFSAVLPTFSIVTTWDTLRAGRRALASRRAYGDWYPVVIDSRRHGSLRWLRMRAGLEASQRPDTVDEAKRGADLYLVEDDCG